MNVIKKQPKCNIHVVFYTTKFLYSLPTITSSLKKKCDCSVMTEMWEISHDWNVSDQSLLKCEWSAWLKCERSVMTEMWVINHDWNVNVSDWWTDPADWFLSFFPSVCMSVSVYMSFHLSFSYPDSDLSFEGIITKFELNI